PRCETQADKLNLHFVLISTQLRQCNLIFTQGGDNVRRARDAQSSNQDRRRRRWLLIDSRSETRQALARAEPKRAVEIAEGAQEYTGSQAIGGRQMLTPAAAGSSPAKTHPVHGF